VRTSPAISTTSYLLTIPFWQDLPLEDIRFEKEEEFDDLSLFD